MRRPSFFDGFLDFFRGMGSVLDIGVVNNQIDIDHDIPGFEADSKALAGDWEAIGSDLYTVLEQYTPQGPKHGSTVSKTRKSKKS